LVGSGTIDIPISYLLVSEQREIFLGVVNKEIIIRIYIYTSCKEKNIKK